MLQYSVTPSWLGLFFTRIKHVSLEGNMLVIHFRDNTKQLFSLSEFNNFSVLQNRLFSAKINLSDNANTCISFLNKAQANQLNQILNQHFANTLEQKINNAKVILKRYALDEFLRDSSIDIVKNVVFSLSKRYTKNQALWQQHLSPVNTKFLRVLSSTPKIADAVAQLRHKYEQKQLVHKEQFYNKVESNPLTVEQRLAIIRNNDKNLVLAAAGTGKTSVIVAKSLDLIIQNKVRPAQILVLAYNKAAAEELKERFVKRAAYATLNVEPPVILTFHALGLKLLQNAKKPTALSTFATDPMLQKDWLVTWFSKKAQADAEFLKNVVDLLYVPVDIFSFKNNAAYKHHIHNTCYTSLAGYKVKNYQALLISNWLYLHSVDHKYEVHCSANDEHISQKIEHSGFYLTKQAIYLAHFDIDRHANPAVGINKSDYNEYIALRRAHYKKNNTALIETFHYNWLEGKLEKRINTLLKQHNVELTPVSDEQIFSVLSKSGQLQQEAEKYLKCLHVIRGEQLTNAQIQQRLKQGEIKNYKRYAVMLTSIHNAYTHVLSAQNTIDFDDMINDATQVVKKEEFKVPWSYILVDEFQDISSARMTFLKTLIEKGENIRFTAVGDDWQAIYRFSGGDLSFTTHFNKLVGSHSLSMLQKTFRYNNSISDIAGRFVMQNPQQYKKQITTHTQVSKPHVVLLDDLHQGVKSITIKVQHTIEAIQQGNPTASIAVLSRYRFMLKPIEQHIKTKNYTNQLHFWTLHSAKGLEADYCIIVGFEQGKLGFPSSDKNSMLVESLLPRSDSFIYSEERRLLYVGITRAKHKTYLIADPYACSAFISELVNDDYPIKIASTLFN